MLNQIKLECEIAGDTKPDLRYFSNGNAYLFLNVMWRGKPTKDGGRPKIAYFNIALYEQIAEQFNASTIWQKGRRIVIEGQLNTWKGKDNKYVTNIIATKINTVTNIQAKPKPKAEPEKQAESIDDLMPEF